MFSGGKIGFWMVSEFHLSIFFPKLAESTDTLGIIGTLTIVSLLIYKYDFLKIDLRERKGGRKGGRKRGGKRKRQTDIDMREKHWSTASQTHSERRIEPETWVCALTKIEPTTFQCTRRCSNQVSQTSQGYKHDFGTSFIKFIPKYSMFFDGILFGDYLGFSM